MVVTFSSFTTPPPPFGFLSGESTTRNLQHPFRTMGSSSNWFGRIRRKFVRSSYREIIVICPNTSPSSHEERVDYEVLIREDASSTTSSLGTIERCLTKEDIAAIKIQAFFRGQLVHNINPTHLFSMQTCLFMRKVLQCLLKI